MKNYGLKALELNVLPYSNFIPGIEKYKINKENNYVSIKYLNGETECLPLSETSVEELDKKQKEGLEYLYEKASSEVKEQKNSKSFLISLHATNFFLNLLNQNFFSATCWLACVGICYISIYRPYKLKQELKLVKWFDENKERVNEVIKEEVETKATYEKSSINQVLIYPKDLVPYSESMYEDGINLNNIDELSDKELIKLKRKTLKKTGVK